MGVGGGGGSEIWPQIVVVFSIVPIAEILLPHFLLGHNIWLTDI
jgi:hypothetical protein